MAFRMAALPAPPEVEKGGILVEKERTTWYDEGGEFWRGRGENGEDP